jgi:hypothetical protein
MILALLHILAPREAVKFIPANFQEPQDQQQIGVLSIKCGKISTQSIHQITQRRLGKDHEVNQRE